MFTKKLIATLFFITFSVVLFPSTAVASANFIIGETSYTMNGAQQQMDVCPYVKDGRTFLPLAYAAQSLGVIDSNIIWDPENQTVTLMKGDKVVQVKIGIKILLVNGESITMDAAPEIANGRTCLPITPVAYAFGETASWDASTQTVTISGSSSSDALPNTSQSSPSPNAPIINITYDYLKYNWSLLDWNYTWPYRTSGSDAKVIVDLFRKLPHPNRAQTDYISTYIDSSIEDEFVSGLAKNFEKLAQDSTPANMKTPDLLKISIVASFIQSLDHSWESKEGFDQYPRYPSETFFERGGDSEDNALLMAGILKKMGFSVALLFLDKNHCAVGVWGADLYGNYFSSQGLNYYYIETLKGSSGYLGGNAVFNGVGTIPSKYVGRKAIVLPLP